MEKYNDGVLSFWRKTRMLLLLVATTWSSALWAQKIDFDNGSNDSYTASGFTAWSTGQITSGNTASKTVDDVTITIGHGSDTQADLIKTNWYKNGVQNATDESKLVNDGIFAGMKDDDYGGYGKTTARVAISVTLSGLSAGTHAVRAYHNYVNGADATLPTIGVAVDGVTQVTGVVQSQQATTLASAASSYVTFTVASGASVTLTYFSEPDGTTTYTTTYFYINSLEIDVDNADNQAQNPSPSNLDYHVEGSTSSVVLSWTAAANSPTSHTVYFGESESSLQQVYSGAATSYTATGLNPKQTYYWRVDETIDGVTYTGTVWSFRLRRLAFPGAEGAGRYAQGGRGGAVYHVTSLSDDGSAGTLRYGLESLTGPRTIVFDVSGEIQLTKTLTCSDPYVTIAGQTAPGIGVMLRDEPFGSNSDDGITRFMRFRYGHGDDWDGASANENTGNAAGLSADYGIMDHCLLGWGSDETFSSRGAKNFSFQHNIIGESLNQNGHKNYWESNNSVQHGYAATIAGDVGSLHHNLLAHNEGRNWSLGGGLDASNNFAGRMNIYNNVVYNWGGRATDGGAHQVNFTGNYYKKGPATTQNYIFSADHEDNFAGTQEYYLNGNLRVSQDGATKTADTLNDTYRETISSGITVDWTTFVSEPYDFYSEDQSNVESAEAAFKNVLSDVGCNYAGLDNNETRLVQESRDGTYTKTGSRSGKKGLVDKESDSEGWSGLGITSVTRPDGWDTDQDGIPDWFETAKGWSTTAANNNVYDATTYYTNLEDYLNWMAEPHFIGDTEGEGIAAGTDKKVTLATYFAGYTSPSYSVSNQSGATATVSGGVLTVNAPSSMAGQLFTVAVTASEGGISLTRNFNFYVAAGELTEITVTETGTVTWVFDNAEIGNNLGEYSTASFGEGFTSNNVSLGSNLSLNGTKNCGGDANYKETAIKATDAIANGATNSNANAVSFTVNLTDGYTFTPTAVSFVASKNGTDGGKLNIYWLNADATESELASNQEPLRIYSSSSGTSPYYTQYSYDLTQFSTVDEVSYGTCGLKLYLHNLSAGKSLNLYNVIISGTLTHTETVAETEFTEDGVTYTTNGTTATVKLGGVTTATVAAEVGATVTHGGKTYAITAVESNAFTAGTALQTIDLSDAVNLSGTVTRFSGIPANTLVYLPDGVAAEGNNMVTKSGTSRTCAALVVTDAMPFNNLYAFTATTASCQRSLLGNANPKTVILPYPIQVPENTKAYTFTSAGEHSLRFGEVGSEVMEANTPYILFPTTIAAGTTILGGTNVVVPARPAGDPGAGTDDGWSFCGTLQGMDNATAASAGVYNLSAGKWHPVTTANTSGYMSPLRCYMKKTDAQSKVFTMELESASGIDFTSLSADGNDSIYNLSGQRVRTASRGVYIRNGKKFVKY